MKRLVLTALLSFMVIGASAQKKVLKSADKAFKKGELEMAISLAKQAAADAETQNNPDVYSILGKVDLQRFIDSDFSDLALAKSSMEYFNKAISVADEKTQEDIRAKALKNPIPDADPIGGEQLGLLEFYLIEISNAALQEENYEKAYPLLALAYEIEPSVDRAFFTAYGAQNSEDEETFMKFYQKVIEYDSAYDNKDFAYTMLIQTNLENEKYDEALEFVALAKADYPNEKNFRDYEIDLLMKADKLDLAIANLEETIASGKATVQNYTTLGYLQFNNENYTGAEETLKAAIQLDPEYGEAIYFLATSIFNQGADFNTAANREVDDEDKYKELREKAFAKFREAMPLYEKKLELDPEDLFSLRPLSTIYDQLEMDDKRDALLDRMDAIEGGGN